jgi:hypothetical protein
MFGEGGRPMFGWFKKRLEPPAAAEPVAHQPPGEVFPWPKGVVITAVDEVVLALPVALLEPDRPMAEFIFGPDDMGFSAPPGSEVCFLRLQPGMAVSLAKSVKAFVWAEDKQPRRVRVSGPRVRAEPGAAPDRGGM